MLSAELGQMKKNYYYQTAIFTLKHNVASDQGLHCLLLIQHVFRFSSR